MTARERLTADDLRALALVLAARSHIPLRQFLANKGMDVQQPMRLVLPADWRPDFGDEPRNIIFVEGLQRPTIAIGAA